MLNNEQLDELFDDLRHLEHVSWDSDPDRVYRALDQAKQVVQKLKSERAAHQEAQAELEAARYVVETARAAKAKHGFKNIEEAVDAYDAVRAGKGYE